ncbi:MAG: hypothetical protein J2P36_19125 [Ktedonobacteraceae bacterium]|nr:hypothetical protein [Ktedonobacteraceae bacterium]
MEHHGIDASLGLALAIELLKQQQQTGELRGRISVAQFLRIRRYQCIIQVKEGLVVSCLIIDELGRQSLADTHALIQTDEKAGPFDWTFYPYEERPPTSTLISSSASHAPMSVKAATVKDDAIPIRLVPELQLSWLTTWSNDDIPFAQQIFSLVNGKRTIRDIKALLFRASPERVEKAFVFLIAMKQVEVRAKGNEMSSLYEN